MTQVEFHEGDVLFHDVDASSPLYFVVLGQLEILFHESGTVKNVGVNELFGATRTAKKPARATCTAQARLHYFARMIPRNGREQDSDLEKSELYSLA